MTKQETLLKHKNVLGFWAKKFDTHAHIIGSGHKTLCLSQSALLGNDYSTQLDHVCPKCLKSQAAINNMQSSQKPTVEVINALLHVKEIHPIVNSVLFTTQGVWNYFNSQDFGKPVVFSEKVDVSILERAADSVKELPAIFELSA